MRINDKDFELFIPADDIAAMVARVAAEVSRDHEGSDLVVCPVLTGAFLFASDLVRGLTVPCEVAFVKYASYEGMASTGTVRCLLPFPASIKGRDVLLVEDVVDSGLTMQRLIADAQACGARSVRVCSLFFKPSAFKGDFRVDYVGREIGNEFIVGYGLDYDQKGRGLKDVWVVK